jgi:hypothetical protein
MELNLQQRRKALLAKIPDMEQTLSVVNFLAARRRKEEEKGDDLDDDDIDALLDGDEEEEDKDKPLTTLFELNDTLYAEAQVQETGEVGLWLGVSGGWGGADPRQTPCSCTPSRRRPSC